MNLLKYTAAFALLSLLLFSCKKKDSDSDYDPTKSGKITLHLENVVGSQSLLLDSTTYQNALGQDFKITTFNYFISNIVLKNDKGETYTVPQDQSYFLCRANDDESREITLTVPEGNYTSVDYIIGVDSARSCMPISNRTGDLDPAGEAADMYWMWNSGYIFMKLEGTSSYAKLDTPSGTRPLMYHIGLFGGYSSPTINNIKANSISFDGSSAKVRAANTTGPEVHFSVDALKVVNGSTNINFATYPVVMVNPYSVNIANNYASMISFEHIHE